MRLTPGCRLTGPAPLRLALTPVAAAVALGAISWPAAGGRLEQLDRAAMDRLRRAGRPPGTVTAALTVSALAEPPVVAALLGVSVLTGRADGPAKILACAAAGSGAVSRALVAGLVARPRPPRSGWLVKPSGSSLPSRHTTLALLGAGACARCAGLSGPAGLLLPAAAGAAVGTSRVILGVHWPGDVLAAGLLGTAWLSAADVAMQACRRSRQPAASGRL